MEQKPKLMTPFDMLVTSSSLYTLKLMLQLKSCLSPEEQTQMSQMEDLMNMMEMMQTMNSDSDGENGFSPMDFMKGVFDNE